VPSKQHSFQLCIFYFFLLITMNETTLFFIKYAISVKWKWHQKSHFPNQSLIFYLFNQVLNCNFDFKNQFNCITVKFKCRTWCWLPFLFWSLVSDLCNLAPIDHQTFKFL
jgi:hypothetical protein